MTIVFDRAGDCPHSATITVEGYTPRHGQVHSPPDVIVRVCETCHQRLRTQLIDSAMVPYSLQENTGLPCGTRMILQDNPYTRHDLPI